MASHLKYAYLFPLHFDGFGQMSFGKRHPVQDRHGRKQLPGVQIMSDLPENPRVSVSGPAYHDSVHSISPEVFPGLLRRVYVPVADNGNVNPGIFLHFPYECPVRFTLVHLAACPSVYCQCLDSCILQPFCQFYYYLGIFVPSEPGLHCDRKLYGIHYHAGNHYHLVRLFHHAGSRPSAGNLVHRTSEIDVDKVRPVSSDNLRSLFRHFGRIYHRFRNIPVNLDAYGSFIIVCKQFGQ